MSNSANENSLKQRHYCFLVLRLTLDHRGRLLQGELVGMTNTLWRRFTSLAGMNQAIEAWLKQQERFEDSMETESTT
ncbi:MAG: hypothetical protein KDI79_23900 [Anaerolineae bacterium]|nr:hypothetical protein [Anaerolineae bacterium]